MPNEIENKELGVEGIVDFLKDDEKLELPPEDEKDDEKDEKEDESKEEKKEDKDDESEEIKLKEDKEDDEDKEEAEIDIRLQASRKQLLKDFPELFKKHPWVEKAIYRNNDYTELFPTIEEAKEASQATEMLNGFRNDLMNGNLETTLSTIKNNDAEAFNKVVDGYLPQLAKVDKEAYYHVIGNVIKTLTINMTRDARKSKDENLEAAAALVNKWMFADESLQQPTNLSKSDKDSEEKTKLQKEREDFQREKYEAATSELDRRVEHILKGTIADNIDPKDAMSEYVKKNAVREAHEALEDLIRQDNTFVSHLNKLWERAIQQSFSKSSIDAVRSAYLSKARTLLPGVIKKARAEALKGLGRKTSTDEKDKRGPITPGRSASLNSGKVKNAQDIPKGMNTLEFLNSED